MSTERDVAPILRSWFRADTDGSVDHVIDAILAEVRTTSQRGTTWWPARRTFPMHAMIKYGIAAAVVAMTLAIGYGLWQNFGNLIPNPQPADESPSSGGVLPPEFAYTFIGEPRPVDGLPIGDRLILDFTDSIFAVHTDPGTTEVVSRPTMTAAGDLHLETLADSTVCAPGDVGTYRFAFSPGGTVLTIHQGDDECAVRARVVPGEWRRSACLAENNVCLGKLEAGEQRSLAFDPFAEPELTRATRHGALAFEIPAGWVNTDDGSQLYVLVHSEEYDTDVTNGCLDCPDGIWIAASPTAVAEGCENEPDRSVGTSARALADWVRAHPGLESTDGPAIAVDGRPTFVLDIVATESYTDPCQDPEFDVTHVPLFTGAGIDYGIRTGDRQRLYLVEIDNDTAMLIGVDSFDPAELDALAAETQPIVASIRLTAP